MDCFIPHRRPFIAYQDRASMPMLRTLSRLRHAHNTNDLSAISFHSATATSEIVARLAKSTRQLNAHPLACLEDSVKRKRQSYGVVIKRLCSEERAAAQAKMETTEA